MITQEHHQPAISSQSLASQNGNPPSQSLDVQRQPNANTRFDVFLKRSQRLVVPLVIAILIFCVLMAGGFFSSRAQAIIEIPRPLNVIVVQAEQQTGYEVQRSYLGRIESSRNSRIGFELGGKINSLYFDEGQLVETGDVLAELDTEILQSSHDSLTAQLLGAQAVLDELNAGPRQEAIAAARADVDRWEAQLKLAQITKDRVVRLSRSNSVSIQEADEATYNERTIAAQLELSKSKWEELVNGTRREKILAQRAAVNQLQAQRNSIAIQIKKSQLKAPFGGVVSSRILDEGEVIGPGQAVFELIDIARIEARVGLPVDSIDSVSNQRHHELVFRGNRVAAVLKSIRPEKNSSTRTIDVVFELPEMAMAASIGDVIRLEVAQPVTSPGFWIPSSALVETYRGLWGCYVAVDPDAKSETATASLRELEVLHQEGNQTFVRGALTGGESVITSGVHRLVVGQTIRVVDAEFADQRTTGANSTNGESSF